MITNIATIIIIGIIVWIVVKFFKSQVTKFSQNAKTNTFNFIGDMNVRRHRLNEQAAKLDPKSSYATSKRYRIIETMIRDLDLGKATVEGYTTFMIVLFVAVISVVGFLSDSLMTALVVAIGALVLINAGLYMLSTEAYYTRCYAIMDAEDLITSSLKKGANQAIRENLDLFHESVRQRYRDFIDRVNMKMSVEDSLVKLKTELGYESYDYIDKLIRFEQKGRQDLLDIFQDNALENSSKREDMLEVQLFMKDLNNNFIMCIGIALFMASVVLMNNKMAIDMIFGTFLGKIGLVINLFMILLGFVRIQSLRS